MKRFNKIFLVVFIFANTESTVFGMMKKRDVSQAVKMQTDLSFASFVESMKPLHVNASNVPIDFSATRLENLRHAAVCGDLDKVRQIMETIAPDQRAAAVLSMDKEELTLLNAAFCGFCPTAAFVILDFIPQDQRAGVVMFRYRDGETILHKIVQGFAVCNVYELGKLLQIVPVDQRVKFILAFDRIGCTVFDYLVNLSSHASLDVIVNVIKLLFISIPKDLRADVLSYMNRSGNTPLHSAVLVCQLFPTEEHNIVNVIKALLNAIPEERRVGAIMAKNSYGESVYQTAWRCGVLKALTLFSEYYAASMMRTLSLLAKTKIEPK